MHKQYEYLLFKMETEYLKFWTLSTLLGGKFVFFNTSKGTYSIPCIGASKNFLHKL